MDLLQQGNDLLLNGKPAAALEIFDGITKQKGVDEATLAAAFLGRATAAEWTAKSDAPPFSDPKVLKFEMESYRWLDAHRSAPGVSVETRLNFEARLTQGLLIAKRYDLAVQVGRRSADQADRRYAPPRVLSQLQSILAQAYAGKGDPKQALGMYQDALLTDPKSPEVPLIRQAMWAIRGLGGKPAKADWEKLLKDSGDSPYAKQTYGNYATFLLEGGDHDRLRALGDEYHRRYDKSTAPGSFETCAVDWQVALSYGQTGQKARAGQMMDKLRSNCTHNIVGSLASDYVKEHPDSSSQAAVLPISAAFLTALVLWGISRITRRFRPSPSSL